MSRKVFQVSRLSEGGVQGALNLLAKHPNRPIEIYGLLYEEKREGESRAKEAAAKFNKGLSEFNEHFPSTKYCAIYYPNPEAGEYGVGIIPRANLPEAWKDFVGDLPS